MSHNITSACSAPPVCPSVLDSSDGSHSPPPAIRPPATAAVDQHELEASDTTSKVESLCRRCGLRYVALFDKVDPVWCGVCAECDLLIWSTQKPLAIIPGCPCALTAGAVVCVCGRRASEHCPDKENHGPHSAVRKQHARAEWYKWQALRRGYENLKKTVHYHKRYLQAMSVYAPPFGKN